MPYSVPTQHQSTVAHSSVTGECKPIRIATSQSAQCLRSLPSLPLPRPFASQKCDKNDPDSIPPLPLPDSFPSNAANLGLKTPSAFFPLPHYVGHDAQLVSDQHSHDLASLAADNFKQGVQYSSELPGRDVAQTLGDISAPLSTEDEKQYMNVPFPTQVSPGKPSQTLKHARDGTSVSEQQAHEVAYSTEMPIWVISQHSKALHIPREASDQTTENKRVSSSGSSNTATGIPGENKQTAREGVITASRHPVGVSFSTRLKEENSQTTEPISDLLHGNGVISTIQNYDDSAHSCKGPNEKPKFPSHQQSGISGTNFLQDRVISVEQYPYDIAYSSASLGQKSSLHSFPIKSGSHNVPEDSSMSQYLNSVPRFSQVGNSGVIPHDATFLPYSTNISGQVVHSVPIGGDSMPKLAHVMQQSHLAHQEQLEPETAEHELAGKLEQLTGISFFSYFSVVCFGTGLYLVSQESSPQQNGRSQEQTHLSCIHKCLNYGNYFLITCYL